MPENQKSTKDIRQSVDYVAMLNSEHHKPETQSDFYKQAIGSGLIYPQDRMPQNNRFNQVKSNLHTNFLLAHEGSQTNMQQLQNQLQQQHLQELFEESRRVSEMYSSQSSPNKSPSAHTSSEKGKINEYDCNTTEPEDDEDVIVYELD